uniref:GLOBIN domain-containing protein n=1 Tax=Meloidogyne hapla TaxID=6305 RepID=A0A1I8BDP5_MELHA
MRYTNYLSKIVLARTLNQVDIGNEIVIHLLNDKRSLFKNLLEQSSPYEKEIKNIYDKKSLSKYSPRSLEISNGVTKFFKNLSLLLNQKGMEIEEKEDKLVEICKNNGKMHYQMKVWFQAENWICLENSVIETIIKGNNLEKENFESNQTIIVWSKLMQAIIGWMKQGFAEAEMKARMK